MKELPRILTQNPRDFVTAGGTTQCKIGSAHGVIWARSHLAYDPTHNFNADAIARKYMSQTGSVASRVDHFEVAMRARLTSLMIEMQKTDRPWFDSRINKPVLDCVFGTLEGGRPSVFRRQFRMQMENSKVNIETVRLDCPGNCAPGDTITELGFAEAMEATLRATPNLWDQGIADGLRSLIKAEIEACPKSVGPPIAIVRLDAHGLTWLCRGACSRKGPLAPAVPNGTLTCNESE
jgi:hypothetical protein